MSQTGGPALTEEQRWLQEQNRSVAERQHDRQDEFFRHMNETAINASHVVLRTILLINGGAAIALLSFDGRLPSQQAKAVAATLLWFALGVVATTVAMVFTYFTHLSMAGVIASRTMSYEHPFVVDGKKTSRRLLLKLVLHIVAAVAAFVALSLFVVGMLAVRSALLA